MAKKITEELVNNITAQVAEEFKGATEEAIKTAILVGEAKRKENKALNAESIKLYRARAEEGRQLGIRSRALRNMLKEPAAVTVDETMGFIDAEASQDELKALLARIQSKLK